VRYQAALRPDFLNYNRLEISRCSVAEYVNEEPQHDEWDHH
jgi:hypothetical protein